MEKIKKMEETNGKIRKHSLDTHYEKRNGKLENIKKNEVIR